MRRQVLTMVVGGLLFAAAGCSSPAPVAAPDRAAQRKAPALVAPRDGEALVETPVLGEARMLRGEAPVALAHAPVRVAAVYSYDAKGKRVDYQEGRDWRRAGSGIARTASSRVPDFDRYRYSTARACQAGVLSRACASSVVDCLTGARPCSDKGGSPRFAFMDEPRNPPLTIGYNVYVDYVARLPEREVRPKQPSLARARRVVCLGDSIAAGAHTVAHYYRETDEQSWCGLLASQFRGQMFFRNISVPGSAVDGLDVDKAFGEQPFDAAVIGFGMNDHIAGQAGLAAFEKKLGQDVARLRQRGVQLLLVGFFQQNPLWENENRADTIAYNRAIAAVARRNRVAFVDIAPAFERAAGGREPYYHLTADFMHHPNIYGQRIYFSLLLPYFIDRPLPVRQVTNYVQADW